MKRNVNVLLIAMCLCILVLATCETPVGENADEDIGLHEIGDYVAGQPGGKSADDPVNLRLTLQLTDPVWRYLLLTIELADKYTNLDLSACTRSDDDFGAGLRSNGIFDPATTEDGKEYITAITLPDEATLIFGTFKHFTSLKTVNADNVTAFSNEGTFSNLNLESVSFPSLENTHFYTFAASSLEEAYLPKIKVIGHGAFSGTQLKTISFPEAEEVLPYAFVNCSSLEKAYLGKVKTIGVLTSNAFFGNTAMKFIDLSSLERMYASTFANTGDTDLIIKMGSTAPTILGNFMFIETNNPVYTPKHIIIIVPTGATGYDQAWQASFRGNTSYIDDTPNQSIMLEVRYE